MMRVLFPLLVVLQSVGSVWAQTPCVEFDLTPDIPTSSQFVTLQMCGIFADACWQLVGSSFSRDASEIQISLGVKDMHGPGIGCAAVITTICADAPLGPLPPGHYEVHGKLVVYSGPNMPPFPPRYYSYRYCFSVGPATTIAQAKRAHDGTHCTINNAVVTASFPDCFYISGPPDIGGIKVVPQTAAGPPSGREVRVQGSVQTAANRERFLGEASVTDLGEASAEPLHVRITHLCVPPASPGQCPYSAADVQHTSGLLVRCTGWVAGTGPEEGVFTIREGPPLPPGFAGSASLRVIVPAGMGPAPGVGDLVSVTGISAGADDGSGPCIHMLASDGLMVHLAAGG